MSKEIEITLPNGMVVGIYRDEDEVTLGLMDQNDYIISDLDLSENEIEKLKDVLK